MDLIIMALLTSQGIEPGAQCSLIIEETEN